MKKYLLIISSLIAFLAIVGLVSANQSYLSAGKKTAAATTTVTYMTPGTATTTITYDTYDADGDGVMDGTQKTDGALVLLQSIASTSASVQTINVEYSMDNIDWFSLTPAAASSTASQDLDTALAYTLTGNATASTTRRAVFLETPTRYLRVVISATTGNSSIWGWVLPWKERNN